MTVVFARVATAGDSDPVARLVASARTEAPAHRGVPFERVPGPESLTIVGGVGTTVFGVLHATRTDVDVWTIHVVHVERDARGVGIGDALVGCALAELRRAGASAVESGAQPGDRALKNLFERHGLVARTIIVGRTL